MSDNPDYDRYVLCTDAFSKTIQILSKNGMTSSDILEAMAHIVVESCVMNGVTKEEFQSYLGKIYERASEAKEHAEVVVADHEPAKG